MKKHFFLICAILITMQSFSQNKDQLIAIPKAKFELNNYLQFNNIQLILPTKNYYLIKVDLNQISESFINKNSYKLITDNNQLNNLVIISKKNRDSIDFSLINDLVFSDYDVAIAKQGSNAPEYLLKNQLVSAPLLKRFRERSSNKLVYKPNENKVQDTSIVNFINDISIDSLNVYLQDLQNFETRFCLAGNRKAIAEWIKNKFVSFGIADVKLDSFQITTNYGGTQTTWQYNVVATIQGSSNLDDVIIVGGHHDAILNSGNPWIIAPGADDNATSVATCFEIARVMQNRAYVPEKTIKFITFAAEELGLFGSIDYAQKAFFQNEAILLMINNDMTSNCAATTNWKINLQNYMGSEWVTSLARDISINYSLLTPVDVNDNSSGSDSYPFWAYGFPAIFLQEYEFSPYYHSINDVVANCNIPYFAEVVKVCAGMMINQDKFPLPIANYYINDAGNGNQLIANWSAALEPDVIGYIVYIGNTSNNYSTSYFTTDTTYILTNLIEGNTYYIAVSCVDNEGRVGVLNELSAIPFSIPLAPKEFNEHTDASNIYLSWKHNSERDILGYNVYRSISSGSGFIKINNLINSLNAFTDATAVPHQLYYYKVTALDSLLNESVPSSEIKSMLSTMDLGILVVDDSEGGVLSPSDATIDAFYDNLLSGFTHTNHDATSNGAPTIYQMGQYSTVLWHSQNSQSNTTLRNSKELVKKYLQRGGNMLFALDRPSRAVEFNSSYPSYYSEEQFMNKFLKIASVQKLSYSRFSGALPNTNDYQYIMVDSSKCSASNNYHLLNIESITPNAFANTIFKYDSRYDSTVVEGNMKGFPVGIEYLGVDYNVITLSFPLYYMKFNQAQDFIQFVLTQKFDELLQTENIIYKDINQNAVLQLYPNPTINDVNLNFNLPNKTQYFIEITNQYGRKVFEFKSNTAAEKGNYLLNLDFHTQNLPTGFYYCTLRTENASYTSKLVIVK